MPVGVLVLVLVPAGGSGRSSRAASRALPPEEAQYHWPLVKHSHEKDQTKALMSKPVRDLNLLRGMVGKDKVLPCWGVPLRREGTNDWVSLTQVGTAVAGGRGRGRGVAGGVVGDRAWYQGPDVRVIDNAIIAVCRSNAVCSATICTV